MMSYLATSRPRTRILVILLAVVVMTLVVDQASKSWAVRHAVEPHILVPGHLLAYSVQNDGFVLGIGRDNSTTGPALGLAAFVWLAWLARCICLDYRRWRAIDALGCGLLLAGILGNTIDRLALGYVRDFLVTAALPNLAFNVADLCVLAGGVTLAIARFAGEWADRRAASAASNTSPAVSLQA